MLLLLFAVLMCIGFSSISSAQRPINETCLACICEAVTGCNRNAKCTGIACGPYHMTQAFWADGGKLTVAGDSISSEQAYQNCAKDAKCAANTIQHYMTKFKRDCNGDDIIDCYDFAAIHFLGSFGCKGFLGERYTKTFNECLNPPVAASENNTE